MEGVDDPLSNHHETENSEDIKEEVKEEESVHGPLSIQEWERRRKNANICPEVKEEGIVDDILFIQEIHSSRDGEYNTVIDIIKHKTEIDNYYLGIDLNCLT